MNLKSEEIKEFEFISTDETINSITETISKNNFQNQIFFQIEECHYNQTYNCIDQLVTNKNQALTFDAILDDKNDKNLIILIINEPCGTCQIALRLLQQLQFYYRQRISNLNYNKIQFLVMNVKKYNVPVILQFEKYPQLLIYPKTVGGKARKSIQFEMSLPLSFSNLFSWILASLDLETRFFVALELKSKSQISNSPDAIRSMYNEENIKIKKYQNQISQLQQSENKLKKSNYEKSRKISDLENARMSEDQKLKKLEILANEMLQTMNSSINETN
jgi:thiol-disulfide isomerase/thioredoxin